MKTFLVVLSLVSTLNAHAGALSMRSSFDNQEIEIKNGIDKLTGRYPEVFIMNSMKPGCYDVQMTSLRTEAYRTTVVVCDVTDENIKEKTENTILLLSQVILNADQQVTERLAGYDRVASATAQYDISVDNGDGMTIGGAPQYVDVWMQLPGVKHSGKSQWLRSRLTLSEASKAGNDGIVAAKLNTSIWETGTSGDVDGFKTISALMRVGTLKVTGAIVDRSETGAEKLSRLDFEVVGGSMNQTLRITKNVALTANQAAGIGMRLIEQNSATFRFAGGTETHLGLLIKNKLYLGGHVALMGSGEFLGLTVGGEVAYRAKKNLTFKAAVDHVKTDGDPMATKSDGVNVNAGYFWRF